VNETATDVEARSPEADSAAAAESTPEVRPEELSQGTAQPISDSAFPQEIVDELRAPLDPNRVRRRKGRGNTQLEYLAGHDVKRRANELFGFGNWGHEVVHRELLGAVQVTNSNGKEGWHVGYATTVRVWVDVGIRTFHTEGVGYGDGVEYTPAARIQACELAIKESETDALKRAFTDLGDQFGLILYAKGDEKARIERDESKASTTGALVRVEAPNASQAPGSFTETLDRLVIATGHPAEDWTQWWVPQLIEVLVPGKGSTRDMNHDERNLLGQRLSTVVLKLEGDSPGASFPPPTRADLQDAFGVVTGGVQLEGPPWRIGPEENDRPTVQEWAELNKGGNE
jgi:hypothetical protein